MKAITHESLHHDLTTDGRNLARASAEKSQAKPHRNPNEVETTMWVLMALFFTLVVLFGLLFWNKF